MKKVLVVIAILLAAAACGGAGSSSTANGSAPQPKGAPFAGGGSSTGQPTTINDRSGGAGRQPDPDRSHQLHDPGGEL